jgi:putative toxin-antitoxin system antitoxin component (TIGR02293 family)
MATTRTESVARPAIPRPIPGIRAAKINAAPEKETAKPSTAFIQRIRVIRNGIPPNEFRKTARRIGLAQNELAQKLGLSPRTLASRKTKLNAEETEKTIRTKQIFDQAIKAFGSEEEARIWFTTPAYGLEDQKPIDLLDTDLGAAHVRSLLSAIEYGNYW